MTQPFRRRVEKVSLRWQARLDSEWSDRVLPWVLAGGLFVILELLALAKARSLQGSVDLAAYTQAAWKIHHGMAPITTVTSGTNVLAQQASFAIYPISAFTFVLPIQPALLVLQSSALALALVPIWRIARRLANLRVGAALVLVAVYAMYPTMHNLNLAGFYPETLAFPALLYAAYFGLSRHWRRFIACCVIVVLCRADLGLAVSGLGALLWAEGRKPEGRGALFGGSAYTLLAVFVVQPYFGDGGTAHIEAFAAYGSTPGAVGWGLITHPLSVLSDLFREQNFQLFVTLFAPVAFLPLLAPRYLFPVVPLQFLFFVSNVKQDAVFGQQTIAVTAFIFLAGAFALAKVGRMGVEKVTVDKRLLSALLLAAAVFFIRDAGSSPYRVPWNWGGRDGVDMARVRAAERIGPDIAVRASPSVLTVVAEREKVYELVQRDVPDADAAAQGVDAVVLDDRAVAKWTVGDHRAFGDRLERLGLTQVSAEEGIKVFLRSD